MAISICSSPHFLFRANNRPFIFFPTSPSSHSLRRALLRFRTLKTGAHEGGFRSGDAGDPVLLRKPLGSSSGNGGSIEKASLSEMSEEDPDRGKRSYKEKGDEWVDWEDQILEETVPLVGFVKMIIHSGIYESGEKLSAEHEKTILERLLPYHPEFEMKIGCGIDYITIGYHPDFENSRCLFIVRKDEELIDFSYWKCIKGLIRKNYPLYADSFILRHFQLYRRGE